MKEQNDVQQRLTNVEDRLQRLENLLVSINEKLEQTQQPTVKNLITLRSFNSG